VARAALVEDIVLAPGNVFSVSETASEFLRFNVAQSSNPRIWEMMRRAVQSGH
jgi:DNA-binding transcriptional MocR family regulator